MIKVTKFAKDLQVDDLIYHQNILYKVAALSPDPVNDQMSVLYISVFDGITKKYQVYPDMYQLMVYVNTPDIAPINIVTEED